MSRVLLAATWLPLGFVSLLLVALLALTALQVHQDMRAVDERWAECERKHTADVCLEAMLRNLDADSLARAR